MEKMTSFVAPMLLDEACLPSWRHISRPGNWIGHDAKHDVIFFRTTIGSRMPNAVTSNFLTCLLEDGRSVPPECEGKKTRGLSVTRAQPKHLTNNGFEGDEWQFTDKGYCLICIQGGRRVATNDLCLGGCFHYRVYGHSCTFWPAAARQWTCLLANLGTQNTTEDTCVKFKTRFPYQYKWIMPYLDTWNAREAIKYSLILNSTGKKRKQNKSAK